MTARVATPPSVFTVPKPGESLRGFMIRACEHNGWPGLGRFLTSLGLKQSDCWPHPDRQVLAKAFGVPADRFSVFVRWSDDPEGLWPIARARRKQRFICPQCLAAGGTQPDWSDLDFVTACPIHGTDLVGECGCGSPLTWRDHILDTCIQCAAMVCHLPLPPAPARDLPFERYALGRLGRLEVTPLPVLDQLPPGLALDFVDALAKLETSGFTRLRKPLPEGRERSSAAEGAFAAIAAGDLSQIFHKVVLDHRRITGNLSPKTPIETLGTFADFAEDLSAYPLAAELIRSGLESALGFPVHVVDQCDYVHIDTVAADARRDRRSIVIWLVDTGQMHLCFPRDDDLFLPIDVAWSFMRHCRMAAAG